MHHRLTLLLQLKKLSFEPPAQRCGAAIICNTNASHSPHAQRALVTRHLHHPARLVPALLFVASEAADG
jgi:hypothetical protein